jgi:hypothetical protein
MPIRVRGLRDWTERRPALAGLGAFALVSGLVRIADYAKPLSSDPAQFLYVGDTIGRGGMPYADAAFSKGPLTAALFAVIDPLAGASPTLVRLSVVPFAALAALALAGYVSHHAGRAAGLLAGLLCAALSGIQMFEGAEGKTEEYGVAPMFGALWLATGRGPAAAAGSGALVACAILINPALGLIALPVAAELWLGTPRGERARRFGLGLAGALGPTLVAAVWLVAGGALGDALSQMGEQIRSTGSDAQSFLQPLEQARSTAGDDGNSIGLAEPRGNLPAGGLWLMALLGCVVAARERRLRGAAAVLGLALVAVLLRVKLSSYEFDYHYYPALPALAGAVALGVASLWPPRSVERIAIAALVLAFPLWSLVIRPQKQLLAQEPPARLESAARAVPVADFVRGHTDPGERIFVAGGRAEVYWRAERRAPTRFFDVHGLTSAADVAERDRDLARNPPAAVAVVSPDRLDQDPSLERFVEGEGYAPAYDAGGSRVWIH